MSLRYRPIAVLTMLYLALAWLIVAEAKETTREKPTPKRNERLSTDQAGTSKPSFVLPKPVAEPGTPSDLFVELHSTMEIDFTYLSHD